VAHPEAPEAHPVARWEAHPEVHWEDHPAALQQVAKMARPLANPRCHWTLRAHYRLALKGLNPPHPHWAQGAQEVHHRPPRTLTARRTHLHWQNPAVQ